MEGKGNGDGVSGRAGDDWEGFREGDHHVVWLSWGERWRGGWHDP